MNDDEKKIFLRFDTPRSSLLQLYEITAVNLESGGVRGHDFLYSGIFEIINDELHFAEMVFQRVENYTPINPADWLPYVR
jgi:hypothetical protein